MSPFVKHCVLSLIVLLGILNRVSGENYNCSYKCDEGYTCCYDSQKKINACVESHLGRCCPSKIPFACTGGTSCTSGQDENWTCTKDSHHKPTVMIVVIGLLCATIFSAVGVFWMYRAYKKRNSRSLIKNMESSGGGQLEFVDSLPSESDR
mmetsp:Transcript_31902/g.36271  ORF Transcript_31902/g.36271 Transcript_31902/m.36271 type:complete len:151 (+) Transcript_31902:151-603(+)